MPGDGPGRDDGGGEEAGWAWELLRLVRGEGCYNITLPDVHGSIAVKRGGPDWSLIGQRICLGSTICGRDDLKQWGALGSGNASPHTMPLRYSGPRLLSGG